MIKNSFLLPVLLLFPLLVFSQKLEVGLFGGASNYFGDLADGLFVTKETHPGYGALLRYNVTPKYTLKFNLYAGKISGADSNSPATAIRDYTFSSAIQEFSANVEWNILGKPLYNNAGEFRSIVTPYLAIGIGAASAPGKPVPPAGLSPNPLPEADDVDVFLVVPFSAGVKYYMNEFLVLGLDGGFRTPFSDYLDGVSKTGNPSRNDWYMFGGVTVSYLFYKDPDFFNK